jgi:hypothetical protein
MRKFLDLSIELNSIVLQRHTPHPHSLHPLDCTTEVKIFFSERSKSEPTDHLFTMGL